MMPILEEVIEQFMNEANERETIKLPYGTTVKPHQTVLPTGTELEDYQPWSGKKKTMEGLLDNNFGNYLLLGTDKNRI